MSALALDWRRILVGGACAGIVGGVLFGALLVRALAPKPAMMAGRADLIALYAAVSLAWGIGYAYLAATRPQINEQPVLSGAVFGVVVYVVMQLVLYGIAAEQTHAALQVAYGIIASSLFFGLPIALVTRLFASSR